LAELHSQLDQDVAQAYGWPASRAADNDAIARGLGELNRLVASGEIDYEPFPMGTGPTLFD
jgi:hypothetical protein